MSSPSVPVNNSTTASSPQPSSLQVNNATASPPPQSPSSIAPPPHQTVSIPNSTAPPPMGPNEPVQASPPPPSPTEASPPPPAPNTTSPTLPMTPTPKIASHPPPEPAKSSPPPSPSTDSPPPPPGPTKYSPPPGPATDSRHSATPGHPSSYPPAPPAVSRIHPPPLEPNGKSTSNPRISLPPPRENVTSTSVVVMVAVGAVAMLALLSIMFLYCCKKKKGYRSSNYNRPPSFPSHSKGDPNVHPKPYMQYKAPSPYGNTVMMLQNGSPGSIAQLQLHQNSSGLYSSTHPPQYFTNSAGSGSYYSDYEVPQAPSSSGMPFGMTQSTFTYDELAMATDGFSNANLLGQGGFGYVHKGILPNGKEIAVKQLKSGSGQGEREFQAEVEIISRVHHRHLVSLVGYCITGSQRMLVYEFVPNNTLEFHLHGKDNPTLDWSIRQRIALGSAKGLAYLHEDCHPKIIHRDIKAANILIDSNFEAMVADFGLARVTSDVNTHVSTRVMGTFGYLAPEYASSGKLTEKSDVFSFGVMLLELITGRRPVNSTMDESLVDWARPYLTQALEDENFEDIADPNLENNFNCAEMTRLVACAAACVRHSAKRRPKMSQMVRALEGDACLSDLSENAKADQSSVYSSHESLEYNTMQYNVDMKKFRAMALQTEEYNSSEYSAEYDLNPSASNNNNMEKMIGQTRRKSGDFGGNHRY